MPENHKEWVDMTRRERREWRMKIEAMTLELQLAFASKITKELTTDT